MRIDVKRERRAVATVTAVAALTLCSACPKPRGVTPLPTAGVPSPILAMEVAPAPSTMRPRPVATDPDGEPSAADADFERLLRDRKAHHCDDEEPSYPCICSEQTSARKGLLVAVCNSGHGGHADEGWVDFYQVDEASQPMLLKAKLEHVLSGWGYGSPGKVTPIALGDDKPGFLVDDGYADNGERSEGVKVVGLLDGVWKELADLNRLVSNTGNHPCDQEPGRCIDLHLTLDVVPEPGINRLRATLARTRFGRSFKHIYVLPFDRARGVYLVPKDLNRTE